MEQKFWRILKDKQTGKRKVYFFGSAKDFEQQYEEKFKEKEEIPVEDWGEKEFSEVMNHIR